MDMSMAHEDDQVYTSCGKRHNPCLRRIGTFTYHLGIRMPSTFSLTWNRSCSKETHCSCQLNLLPQPKMPYVNRYNIL